jgi:DNA-binding NarL/FixJ family response regulator
MSEPDPTRADAAPTRILVVDDHPLVRQGIRMLVGAEPDLEVCGEAEDAAGALLALKDGGADVAVVDLALKDSSGLELIKDMHQRFPKVRVLVVSMRNEGLYAERALRAGAHGYVTKEEGPEEVLAGIRRVRAGEIHVSPRLASQLMSRIVPGAARRGGRPSVEHLTDRELEVLELIGQGLATGEVARRLHISPKTVESHREHLKEKLGLGSAPELLKFAIQWQQAQ